MKERVPFELRDSVLFLHDKSRPALDLEMWKSFYWSSFQYYSERRTFNSLDVGKFNH